jgi:hypothetical protein
MAIVIFAYSSTITIPSAGSARKSVSVVFSDDSKIEVIKVDHEVIGFEIAEDVIGKRLHLLFKIGAAVLSQSAERTFFKNFFSAKHRWAVFGDFKDTTNSANDNLCKAVLTETEYHAHVDVDLNGTLEIVSEKVF